MNYASERQRASVEIAERERDRILMAGPPEPRTADLTVEYEVWLQQDQSLSVLTEALGGSAHWAGDESPRERERPAAGSTLIEEATSYEQAEEIVQNLVREHLRHFVDMDTLIVTAERIEADEPDWDARAKDERAEREFDREHGG